MRVLTKGKTVESKRKYMREYMKERRLQYKEHGLCIQCGSPAEKGKTLCNACLKRQAAASIKYREGVLNGL